MNRIKRVYIGLPDRLVKFVLWVTPEWRTNPLSHMEGGFDVVIEYDNGQVFGYDRIKSTYAYISSLPEGLDKIIRVFARSYEDDMGYEKAAFGMLWEKRPSRFMLGNKSRNTLFSALQKFDDKNQKNRLRGIVRPRDS